MKQFIYIVLALQLCACSKTEQFKKTTVSGMVIDGTKPGEQVFTRGSVNLVEVETPLEPFTPIISTVIDQQPVQKDGSFKFEFNAKRGQRFSYHASMVYPEGEMFGSGTHNGNITREVIQIDKQEESQEKRFIIYPYSEIKFLVYNQNEFDENDKITRHLDHITVGRKIAGTYIGGGGYENDKENENAQFSGIVSGQMTIEWHVTRNGQTEVFSDEIFVEHNERRVYEIYY